MEKRLLLLVDCQYDFIDGGSLAVPNSHAAMVNLANYIKENKDKYNKFVFTMDYHPADHCSFAEQGGQWPAHCVKNTKGCMIFNELLLSTLSKDITILPKGNSQDKEEYSIFANTESKDILLSTILDGDFKHIDVVGIAGDICVLNTLKDGLELLKGKDVKWHVLNDFCPSLDGGVALEKFVTDTKLDKC